MWAWSRGRRGVRVRGVSGVWPEGTSPARKEREEEPQDLELFPRERIAPDSYGAAAADCLASGGAERSLAGCAWAARCGGGSAGCELGARRRSPARRRGVSGPGHTGCGRPTRARGSAFASLRHTASRLCPAGGTQGPRASRNPEPASYGRTLLGLENSSELGQSPMQQMAMAASRVGALGVGRAAKLQAPESGSRRGRARGGARGLELGAAGGKVVSPSAGRVRPGGALD